MDKYITLISDLVIISFLMYRQLKIRQVSENIKIKVPIILIIIGLGSLENYFNSRPLSLATLISIIVSLLFLAVGMGMIRAYTVRIWKEDKAIFCQGTWFTMGLWVLSIILHLLTDYIGQTGEVTLPIYYGITLVVQSWVVQLRIKRKFLNI